MTIVLQQQSLREPASLSGVGLHGGNRVQMTFRPAPPNTGIRFRRMDLEGQPEVPASLDYVSDTNRSTSLAKGSVKIHTVEHVLATLAGLGIDNVVIELDAPEPPITDGSGREYSRALEDAGLAPQGEAREACVVTEPIEFEAGETLMSVFPHDRLKISCTSADKHSRYTQFLSVEITPDTWKRDLAQARTFCFFEEIEYLIKNGLIKGGSLENAVVIRDDVVLTTEPLRYPDEFVRHKILDILGDLCLLGQPLVGHVVAVRPSHSSNCELARQIRAATRKSLLAAQSFVPPAPAIHAPRDQVIAPEAISVADGTTLDTVQIMKILPHRHPFLMVDKITHIQGNKVTGVKNVTFNEPFFVGHFPGHPVMPGVLQLEAIAQVAGILMLRQAENAGKLAYFMSAENVKWRKPVRPGDCLEIEVELTKWRAKLGKAKGVCRVAGEVVSEGEVTFVLVDG